MYFKPRKYQLLALGKTAVAVFLGVAMVIYPQEVVLSAFNGIVMWGKYVLPALLPFFILSELLMGVGFVHLLGVVLEPIMRPVFRLPGCAGFVLAMSFTSGPPIGAILTAKLRRENMLNKLEAERLIAFTTNSSPGFMLGAVAAGMFKNPGLGVIFAFSNYLANLLLGVAMRYYKPNGPQTPVAMADASFGKRAFRSLYGAQRKDARPIGLLIGDAIRNSINTILLVGGYILFFSVLLRILSILGITSWLGQILGIIFSPLHLAPGLFPSLSSGLFEVTLGIKAASEAAAPVVQKIILASAFMAWNGISVLAQVASFTSSTDIRIAPFIFGRLMQAIFAALFTLVLLNFTPSVAVFSALGTQLPPWETELFTLALAVLITGVICLGLGSCANSLRRLGQRISLKPRP